MRKSLFFILFIFCFSYSLFYIFKIVKPHQTRVLGTNHTQQPIHKAKGNSDDKYVALTFDDGPSPTTIEILKVLEENDVKATFFVIGENIDDFPGSLQRIHEQGHEIGNHTNTHPFTMFMNEQDIAKEILITEEKIFQLTDQRTNFFRAPYALYPKNLMKITSLLGLYVIDWDIDPEDWKNLNDEIIAKNIIEEVKPGNIILLHDGPPELDRSNTVKALETIILDLKEKDYYFITMSEYLQRL